MDDGRACPSCGSAGLVPAGPPGSRAVCTRCGRCWEDGGTGAEVDSLACPGCRERGTCESCPTWLAESMTRRHTLTDGQAVLIRPLLYSDRFQLAAGFAALSPRSRRLRFVESPLELDDDDLEYLTNIDYEDHFACVAVLPDDAVQDGAGGGTGVGVGRYVREEGSTTAEVAVTVLDEYQRRGIGTLLTRTLADVAAGKGIRAFVSYIQWENQGVIERLMAEGAHVVPAEPGLARVELPVPRTADELPDPYLHRLLATFASYMANLRESFQGSAS
jgi:GNAT superfamily N-acetyltransferase